MQPWPTAWNYSGALPAYDAQRDHSNLIQRDTSVICPDLPYELWKSIALQHGHYLIWVDEDRFEEGGIIKTFQEWTHGQAGLWFIAGSFAQCRIYSRYLALQIKACEENIIPPVQPAE